VRRPTAVHYRPSSGARPSVSTARPAAYFTSNGSF
jgi:hypothetical protein